MIYAHDSNRRTFLTMTAAAGAALLIPSGTLIAAPKKSEDVGPAEDLMREHGGLNRILLVYEEGIRRLNSEKDIHPDVLRKGAGLIRTFIEGYHEKLEEEFIFPRMRKSGKLTGLVDTLEQQHEAGRKVTARIEQLSSDTSVKSADNRQKLVQALEAFIRMYRPHESREDTILFPAFHEMLSEKDYDALGEKFEDREHELFGQEGFEGVVEQISALEKAYGIYDLARFTPSTI